MENPVLVEIYRGGVLESFHRGAVCVVNRDGKVIYSLGNTEQICFPRSAMKFFQAMPLVELGGIEKFGLTREEVAITCGSHNGELRHLEVVRSILAKVGVNESELGCGPQYPTYKKDADQLLREGVKPTAIHNNCSGKHAGMLALCVLQGYSTHNYLDPSHPVQQLILKYVSEMYGYAPEKMVCALDGCTAPIYSVPVYQQAIGFMNLVNTGLSAEKVNTCSILYNAVSTYPFMVAGSNRYCTEMMQCLSPAVIGKTGAEGIFCMSFKEQQLGVCIKIDDGKMQPQYFVAQALLQASGLFTEEQLSPLQKYITDPLYNFNKLRTGEIRVKTDLFAGFEERFPR